MQLIYRGQRYQKKNVPATVSHVKFSCVYRSVPYLTNANFSYTERKPKEVVLTYRRVPYRRWL